MQIIGVTGGVATGKSTVTQVFADLGARIVSADQIARDLLAPDTETTLAVAKAFPTCVDGNSNVIAIDRVALRQVIFADPTARRRLENLTHPAIVQTVQVAIDRLRPLVDPPIAAIEIPLLFEAKLEYLVDSILVVTCSPELQIARLCARLSIPEAEAMQHIAAQMSLAKKTAKSDYVITTDGGLEDTRRQVVELWSRLTT